MGAREMTTLALARKAVDAGYSVIPIRADGTKAPALSEWRRYQQRRPDDREMEIWFSSGINGIAVVGGAVSGNLEIIDFDDAHAFEAFCAKAEELELDSLLAKVRSGFLERTPRGFHLLYRCPAGVDSAMKLARTPDGKCTIETRGEGSYAVKSGSPAATHETGELYQLVSGGYDQIATITAEEREDLLALARSLDESPPKEEYRSPGVHNDGERVGDVFDREGSWDDILPANGWRRLFTSSQGVTHWTRPGKKRGTSATTNARGNDYLYVHTTSTVFEPGGYTKFRAYAILEHGGDFDAATRELAALGFEPEETPATNVVNLDAFLSNSLKKREETGAPQKNDGKFPRHLLDVPGAVGDLASFITHTAHSPQPLLALGASLAAMGTIVGRKVRTSGDLRTNLYVLGMAPQGAGKEHARKVIKELFIKAGALDRVAHDKLASDAAIWTAVTNTPSALFMLDEIGRTLSRFSAKGAPAHIEAQVDAYLTLFSQANQVAFSKSYADADRKEVVHQPNLSIYGTTVPGSFYQAMSAGDVASGFLSRFLVFESEGYPDIVHRGGMQSVPSALVDLFSRWEERQGGNLSHMSTAAPTPMLVTETPEAEELFQSLSRRMRGIAQAAVANGDEPGIEVRVAENARKLALIVACGCAFDDPIVDLSHARWACELAEYLASAFTGRMEKHAGESERERQIKQLGAWIEGKGQVTQSQVTRRFQKWDKRLRRELIDDLVSQGRLEKVVEATKTKTRTAFVWRG